MDQLDEDDTGCLSDYDCKNDAGCLFGSTTDENTCVEYYSIDEEEEIPADNCVSNESALCEYSYCAKKSDDGKYYCLEETELEDEETECETSTTTGSSECTAEADENTGVALSTACVCGMNSDA